MKGVVFDIQHYCIHDGPGIRVNVFLKGCPLRCLWCQNPESQKPMPQLMYHAEKCTGCGKCIALCPNTAPRRREENSEKRRVCTDRSMCSGCGECVAFCWNEARSLAGRVMTVEDVFTKVAQDHLFFGKDGGITVTGGEPLMQWEFTMALLKKCRDNKIHTCIETCGYADWDEIKAVMEYVDLVLYDIKHMDSEQHKQFTGVGNEIILRNLQRISRELHKKVIVRVPVIPEFNDTTQNMEQLGRFIVEEIPTCTEINLLPFHNMGESKLQQMDEKIAFHSRTPEDEEITSLQKILKRYGLTVK